MIQNLCISCPVDQILIVDYLGILLYLKSIQGDITDYFVQAYLEEDDNVFVKTRMGFINKGMVLKQKKSPQFSSKSTGFWKLPTKKIK